METAQLVSRCQAGEPAAIEDFICKYQHIVHRLALSILDDTDEVEDATQDVFIAALAGLSSFRGQSEIETWLYAITVNVCLKKLRTRKRWNHLITRVRETWLHDRNTGTTRLEETVLQNEVDATVWAAIQALDDKHRIPMILRYYHHLPVSKISSILGVKEGTVHSRLNKARQRLKAALHDVIL